MLKKKYEILPHPAAFKRRLDKEYSKEVIDKLRNLPLNLAEINHPATTSNHKDIKNKNEIKYENFIQGARVYLKSIEKSKNEKNIPPDTAEYSLYRFSVGKECLYSLVRHINVGFCNDFIRSVH